MLLHWPATSGAQSFPSKPLRIVVGFPPGGGTDIIARNLAQQLTTRIGQQVIVENRPGAGTAIAMEHVAKSAPDGYTILWASDSSVVQPLLRKDFPVAPFRDLTAVAVVGVAPLVISTGKSVKPMTLQEFVSFARANPGKLRYGSGGNGTTQHIAGEMFKLRAGVDLVHVPYKGTAPAITDALGGHIEVVISGIGEAATQIDSTDLRAIAVTSPSRVPRLPSVPTVSESGFSGFSAGSFHGLLAPAGLPSPVATYLADSVYSAAQQPAFQEQRAKFGLIGEVLKGAEANAFMRDLSERMKGAIERARITAE